VAFLWSLIFVDPLIILSTILCGFVSIVVSMFDKSGSPHDWNGARVGALAVDGRASAREDRGAGIASIRTRIIFRFEPP